MRERDWRRRKKKLDAAAAAVVLQDYLDHSKGLMRLLRNRSLLPGRPAVWPPAWRRVFWRHAECTSPTRATRPRSSSSRSRAAPARRRSASGSWTAGVVRDPLTFRAALWLSGRARELKAGEYRFDQPDDAPRVVDKIARGDVYRRLVTFREGLTIPRDGGGVRERRLGQGRRLQKARPETPAAIRDLDPGAHRSRRLSLSGNLLAAPRHAGAAALVAQMVGSFRSVFTAGAARRPPRRTGSPCARRSRWRRWSKRRRRWPKSGPSSPRCISIARRSGCRCRPIPP